MHHLADGGAGLVHLSNGGWVVEDTTWDLTFRVEFRALLPTRNRIDGLNENKPGSGLHEGGEQGGG